jgi:hypothetical protein
MMMKQLIVLMAIVAIAGLANAELITNGDFEAGMSGWSSWGSGSGSGTSGVSAWNWAYKWWGGSGSIAPSGGSDGGQHAVLDTTAMGCYMTWWGWVWQGAWQANLPATEGETLDVDGYASGSSGDVVNLLLEYRDSTGWLVDYDGDGIRQGDPCDTGSEHKEDRQHIQFVLTGGGWEQIAVSDVVPSGLLVTQFTAMWSIEAQGTTFGLDELSIVPEPMTMALFGFGSMLMLRRRKR